MGHRFQAGEQVRFGGGYPYRNAADGVYEVVSRLPFGNGDFQYRIKSPREEHERVVKESELDAA